MYTNYKGFLKCQNLDSKKHLLKVLDVIGECGRISVRVFVV